MPGTYYDELKAFRTQGGPLLLTPSAGMLYQACLGLWNDQRRQEWTRTTHDTLRAQSGCHDERTCLRARNQLAEVQLVKWSESRHGVTTISFQILGWQNMRSDTEGTKMSDGSDTEGTKMSDGSDTEGTKMSDLETPDMSASDDDVTGSGDASRARKRRERDNNTTTTAGAWPELVGIPGADIPGEVKRVHSRLFADPGNPILEKLAELYPIDERRRHIVGYWLAVGLGCLPDERRRITSALVLTATRSWQEMDPVRVAEAIETHLELIRGNDPGTTPWYRVANMVRSQTRRAADGSGNGTRGRNAAGRGGAPRAGGIIEPDDYSRLSDDELRARGWDDEAIRVYRAEHGPDQLGIAGL